MTQAGIAPPREDHSRHPVRPEQGAVRCPRRFRPTRRPPRSASRTVDEACAHPEVFAQKSLGQIADHCQAVIEDLDRKPAIIGHSFGGLLAQILAGRGLAAASVAIDPAPFRGVLPLPISALRSGSVVLRNPANYTRAVPLTFEQFRYSFANVVDEDEAKDLYESYAVPGSGMTIFQAATANLNPWTEAKVDTKNPDRGPMLIVVGDQDHTVPPAIAKASFKRQQLTPTTSPRPRVRGPRARPDARPRLARRRRQGARVRQALRLSGRREGALVPTLRTTFRRATIAADDGGERITAETELRLAAPDGADVRLRDDLVLIEAKSADGDAPFDRLIGLLTADTGDAGPAAGCFVAAARQ